MRRRRFSLLLSAAALSCTVQPTQRPLARSHDWLLGTWAEERGDTTIAETWRVADDGTLRGANEVHVLDALGPVKDLEILHTERGVVYRVSPPDRTPYEFDRSDGGRNWVRFSASERDWPGSVTYRRTGDSLEVVASGLVDGIETTEVLNLTRVGAGGVPRARADTQSYAFAPRRWGLP